MKISENIKTLRESADLTQEQLANQIGVTRSTVTQWESGWSKPRMGKVELLAKFFGVPVSAIVDESSGNNLPKGAIAPTASPMVYAPLLGKVHAGTAQEPDLIHELVALPEMVLESHPRAYFLIVEGNCMSKIYPEGCLILVDPDITPSNGSIAVVSIDSEDYIIRRIFKGAHSMILSPDSWEDKWEDIIITDSDDHTVELAGTVVWFQASTELN